MYNDSKKITLDIDPVTGELTADSARKYFARFGWFCFAMIAITLAVEFIVIVLAHLIPAEITQGYLFNQLLSTLPMYCIALPLGYTIISKLPTVHPLKTNLGFAKWLGGLCIAIFLLMVGNYVSLITMSYFEEFIGVVTENPLDGILNGMPLWEVTLFMVVVAPILEELLFRGIVCKKLLALGEGYAIILSGAFFALFHGNFYQLFYAFTLGCFFGFIYVKTGRLIYTVLYHAAINFLGSVVTLLLQEKVLELEPLLDQVETLINEGAPIGFETIEGYLSALIPIVAYEIIYYAAVIIGIVLICTGLKKFKCQAGMLPPPKKGRFSALFLNSGVAAAIAAFTVMMFMSLAAYGL